jgi:cell division transport system permease protein
MHIKRTLITASRITRSGMVSFTRNVSLAIAAVAVMVVTLTIVLFSLITSVTLNHTINQIADKINISIYLNDAVTAEQRDGLMAELKSLSEVKNVEYVSKDQALAEYRAANANNKDLLAAIDETGNPLPASIQVDPKDPAKIDQVQAVLSREDTVKLEDKQAGTSYSGDRKAAIDKIAHATSVLKQIGIIGVVVFTLVSMLIIFNTIQMAIFNRRDEITIMRLLGATTWYIRGPFVVESIIYGVVSALISITIIDLLFVVASSTLQASSLGLLDIQYANSYFYGNFLVLLTLQLAAGIVIGAASSIIATRRYLKLNTK